MRIFYHNDNDGKCCAALIYQYYNLNTPDPCAEIPITFNKMDYGMRFPIEDISKNEKVYIVDYSIEVNEMKELLSITKDIIWIDHHKSAIEKYLPFIEELNEAGKIIEGERDTLLAGCELVWTWFYKKNTKYPDFVKYVADRDMWRWKYADNTRNYNDGLIIYDTSPNSIIWDDHFTPEVMRDGKVVSKTKNSMSMEQLEERGFWLTFHGYKAFAINSDVIRGSEYFEIYAPDADIWIVFRLCCCKPNPNLQQDIYWTVSLYTKNPDIDVSKIAMNYMYKGKIGGGHKGASGFQSKGLDFLYGQLPMS